MLYNYANPNNIPETDPVGTDLFNILFTCNEAPNPVFPII
jgi:hypothetical protein